MRLSHFAAFAPACPVCAGAGKPPATLILAYAPVRSEESVIQGILHCPACLHEYPILNGVPVIVPNLRRLLGDRGLELLLRDDLDPALESLLGDAIGPDSWLDAIRQTQSGYMWDGYADLDPEERPDPNAPLPGAARRCLTRLLELRGPAPATERVLDLGCAAGRTTFDLAAAHPGALVLGLDIHLGMLRLAQDALRGTVSYPRRRVGLVYDRRRFPVALPHTEQVDFWACDATALPFAGPVADLCVALNLLDCVPEPARLMASLAAAVPPGGHVLLATPYDWSTRATPVESWLGGHSQRAPHAGAAEAFFQALIAPGQPGGLDLVAEDQNWPWHTRLHARSTVQYRTHLTALRRA